MIIWMLLISSNSNTYLNPLNCASDGNDHFFHEPRSFTIMSPNVIKIWATIIHFELSKIWSSITHEWSAIIYNHNYFIFSVNFSWFSPINFQINLKTFFAGDFLWIFAIFFQKLKIFKRNLISPAKSIQKNLNIMVNLS